MIKRFLFLAFLTPFVLVSQVKTEWQHLDPEKDNVLGISTFMAYEVLKDWHADTVLVAVLDNGAELGHMDLQGQFWVNPGEIPDNGIDDDQNGYVDDIHGWNFLGNSKGENIKREKTELTRIFGNLFNKYSKTTTKKKIDKKSDEYLEYLKIKKLYEESFARKNRAIMIYQDYLQRYKQADSVLRIFFKNLPFGQYELFRIKDTAKVVVSARNFLLDMFSANLDQAKIEGIIQNNLDDLKTRLNPFYKIRESIIGDDPSNLNDTGYGNPMVDAMHPYHGTGVAGTIAALHNDTGIHGVARHVKLMVLRILPNGDEADKDVALAIRYAIRNKASIINCSFGKSYSMYPDFVRQAIKEAEQAGVLIVHAAGNDGRNSDSIPTYPTGFYADGSRAANWISVGASTQKDSRGVAAYFSNYGKRSVDLFAPGFEIPSCVLGSKYDLASGTSTAAPVVTGIAAVLKAYFPFLNAVEIKQLIMESVYKPKTIDVRLPGSRNQMARFGDLSVSGGIANVYRAVNLAIERYGKQKTTD
jgi:cell wall-associated protease